MIGYTLPELPELIFPGGLDPFVVTDPAAAVNTAVAQLTVQNKANVILALGHLGGNGGTLTAPDTSPANPPDPLPTLSPLIDFADQLVGVNAAYGGHTHQQFITYRPNGVMVTENINAGVRFNRYALHD